MQRERPDRSQVQRFHSLAPAHAHLMVDEASSSSDESEASANGSTIFDPVVAAKSVAQKAGVSQEESSVDDDDESRKKEKRKKRHMSGAEKKKRRKSKLDGANVGQLGQEVPPPPQQPRIVKSCDLCGVKTTDPDPVSAARVESGRESGPGQPMKWEKPDLRGGSCYYCTRTHERRYSNKSRKALKDHLKITYDDDPEKPDEKASAEPDSREVPDATVPSVENRTWEYPNHYVLARMLMLARVSM